MYSGCKWKSNRASTYTKFQSRCIIVGCLLVLDETQAIAAWLSQYHMTWRFDHACPHIAQPMTTGWSSFIANCNSLVAPDHWIWNQWGPHHPPQPHWLEVSEATVIEVCFGCWSKWDAVPTFNEGTPPSKISPKFSVEADRDGYFHVGLVGVGME